MQWKDMIEEGTAGFLDVGGEEHEWGPFTKLRGLEGKAGWSVFSWEVGTCGTMNKDTQKNATYMGAELLSHFLAAPLELRVIGQLLNSETLEMDAAALALEWRTRLAYSPSENQEKG